MSLILLEASFNLEIVLCVEEEVEEEEGFEKADTGWLVFLLFRFEDVDVAATLDDEEVASFEPTLLIGRKLNKNKKK